MNLALYIYLCEVVGGLKGIFVTSAIASVGVLGVIGFVTLVTGNFEDCYREEKTLKYQTLRNKLLKIFTLLLVFGALLSTLIPSQKTMYAMAAAYYGEQAVKSETFQRLNGKAMQLLEVKIDELIGEKKESK